MVGQNPITYTFFLPTIIEKEGYSVSWKTTHKETLVEYRGIEGLRNDLKKCGMCHSRKRNLQE